MLKQVLLWIYIVALAALMVAAALDPEEWETPTERGRDIILDVLMLVGVVAYARRVVHPKLIKVWRIVAPVLVIDYVIGLIAEWPELLERDPDFTPITQAILLGFVITLVTAFLIPGFVLNFRLAYGKR